MARKAPDWLLSMSADPANNLVEDSPRYRAEEQAQQKQNLRNVASETMDIVATRQAAREAARIEAAREAARLDNQLAEARRYNAEHEGGPTSPDARRGTPMDAGPFEPPSKYTPTTDYEPANPAPPPPSPIGPPASAPDITTPATLAARESLVMPDDDPENDDIVGNPESEVALLSQLSGLPPKQVATLALLGEWGRTQEDREYAAGLPVGRASVSRSDVVAGGTPSPAPTSMPEPMPPVPLGGGASVGGSLMAPPPGYEDIPQLSGPPPSPLPAAPPPA